MTLTALRRTVLAANAVALFGAGASAWHSLRTVAKPKPADHWTQKFPARPPGSVETAAVGPESVGVYLDAVKWPQGEKPRPKPKDDTPPPPPPDPFKTRYRLRGVFVAEDIFQSYALLLDKDAKVTVWVGRQIPLEPWRLDSPLAPWRLDDLSLATAKVPCRAVFHNTESGEEGVLEGDSPGESFSFEGRPAGAPGGGAAGAGPFGRGGGDGAAAPAAIGRQVRNDPARGVVEWEISEEGLDWMDLHSDDELRNVAAVSGKDGDGNPDGLVLKAVPAKSRLYELGFRAEDRVVSVNDTPVSSTAQAVDVGKKQYEGGTSTFIVKVDRGGKILNFTFKPPRRKPVK